MGNSQQHTVIHEKLQSFSIILRSLLFLIFTLVVLSACAPDINLLGGGSWQASISADQQIRAVEVDPNDTRSLYAINENGQILINYEAWTYSTRQVSSEHISITPSKIVQPLSKIKA